MKFKYDKFWGLVVRILNNSEDLQKTRRTLNVILDTAYNNECNKRKKELVKAMRVYTQQGDNLELSRVWFKAYLSRASQEYFDKQIEEYNAKWMDPEYEIPYDERDKMEDIDSELSGIINIKKHSKMYISAIADMTAEIVEDVNSKMVLNKIKRRRD